MSCSTEPLHLAQTRHKQAAKGKNINDEIQPHAHSCCFVFYGKETLKILQSEPWTRSRLPISESCRDHIWQGFGLWSGCTVRQKNSRILWGSAVWNLTSRGQKSSERTDTREEQSCSSGSPQNRCLSFILFCHTCPPTAPPRRADKRDPAGISGVVQRAAV